MTEVKSLSPVTLEEFETMEREEQFSYELIDGVVMMSPSPSDIHQDISGNIYYHSKGLLKNTSCKPYFALDIKVNGNILKPDILIRCKDNLDLPRIVFEVISPSSRHMDLMVKLNKYKQIGIFEYWIIDPKLMSVTVHDYINNTTETYKDNESIQSKAVPELIISVAAIFEDVQK